MDSIYASRLDDPALLRSSPSLSSRFGRDPVAALDRRFGVRRVRRRGGVDAEPGTSASRWRGAVRLVLIPVTGGQRHGDGPAALDFAMGEEFTRRSR